MCLPNHSDQLPIPLLLKSYSSNTWHNTPLNNYHSLTPTQPNTNHKTSTLLLFESHHVILSCTKSTKATPAGHTPRWPSNHIPACQRNWQRTDRRAEPAVVSTRTRVLYELLSYSHCVRIRTISRQRRYYICSYVCSMYGGEYYHHVTSRNARILHIILHKHRFYHHGLISAHLWLIIIIHDTMAVSCFPQTLKVFARHFNRPFSSTASMNGLSSFLRKTLFGSEKER